VQGDRDAFQAGLKELGIGNAVYYPTPIHELRPYLNEDGQPGDWKLPETDRAAREVVSLPVFPSLTQEQLDRIVEGVNTVAAKA
jgi:perosamine synthetase